MSYTKIFIIYILIASAVIAGAITAGYYIDKSQKEHFAIYDRPKPERPVDLKNKEKLAFLQDKIDKLEQMAQRDQSLRGIVEKQKEEINLHINALRNSQ